MSTTTKTRARQAALRAMAEERKTRERRRRRLINTFAPIGAVLLAVSVLVGFKLATDSGPKSGKRATAAEAAVVAQVTSVPAAVFDRVGLGQPSALPKRVGTGPASAAEPRILYIGAEYCPFCAVERWPLIIALSRFGTWENLRYAFSAAAPEVYPDTATFTFHDATYTSRWLTFTGVETHTSKVVNNGYEPLDRLSQADTAIMNRYDPGGNTPFLDIGHTFTVIGATYRAELLGKRSQAEIASTLTDPNSDLGTGIIGAANVLTAAICEASGGQPAQVCTSDGVSAAATALK